jgi:flagellar export protein FliJ
VNLDRSRQAAPAAKERPSPTDNQAVSGTAFRFRLERVRAVRERKEKLAQQELARAISLRSSTEADLRTSEEHLAQAHSEQRSAVSAAPSLSAAELLARQAFLERVEAQRRQHARDLAQREAEVVDRGAALATAASEHEMLNRLRERHRGEHDREIARRERNVLDEIAVNRFGRSPA